MRLMRLVAWGVVAVCAALAAGCGSGGVTRPSEVQNAQEPILAPLQVPDRLRLVWGTVDTAGIPVARFGGINAIALQIGTWGEDTAPFAKWARERGIVVLPYVEQVFWQPRSAWDGMWAKVETWAKPLREQGVLVGWHVTDEWVYRNRPQSVRDEAIAYVRGKTGLETFSTDDVDSVLHRDFRRPAGKWFGVNCYSRGTRTPWHTQGCVETYERHPEWNLVVVPAIGSANIGQTYDQGAWESLAERTGKSLAYWSWDE